MSSKQFGALHLYILIAILAATMVVGLGVIYVLDRSMIAKTVNARGTSKANPAPTSFASDNTTQSPTLGAAENTEEIEKILNPRTTQPESTVQGEEPNSSTMPANATNSAPAKMYPDELIPTK